MWFDPLKRSDIRPAATLEEGNGVARGGIVLTTCIQGLHHGTLSETPRTLVFRRVHALLPSRDARLNSRRERALLLLLFFAVFGFRMSI